MLSLIKNEINRILRNKLFWIIFAFACALTVSQYFFNVLTMVKYLDSYLKYPLGTVLPHTWYEKWIGGELMTVQYYIYFMIIPIIAVVPSGLSLAKDKAIGYQAQIFTRVGKKKYYLSKLIVSFVSAGLAAVVPLLLNLWLSIITLPSIFPQQSTGTSMITSAKMLSGLYYNHPNLYIAIYLCIIFLFAGVFSVLALVLGEATSNGFLSLIFPFMTYVFSYVVLDVMQKSQYAPFSFMTPAQRVEYITVPIVLTEFLVMSAVFGILYFLGAKRNQTID